MKPAPRTPAARAAASVTSFSPKFSRTSRSGFTWTCSERIPLPKMATLATPGTAISVGLISHSALVRRSISEARDEVKPATSTVLVDEVRGVSEGACAWRGSRPTLDASRSETTCRSRSTSLAGSKLAVMIDKP